MKKYLKGISKSSAALIFAFAVFTVVQGAALFLTGDDFTWLPYKTLSDVVRHSDDIGNSRFFTNYITCIIIHHSFLRFLVFTFFLMLLFGLMVYILNYKKEKLSGSVFIISLFLYLLPPEFHQAVISWISGFTNYVISMVLILIYFVYCRGMLEGELRKQSALDSVLLFVLGSLSALCLENITLYCVVFGIFILGFSIFRYKKVLVQNCLYTVGTLIGTALMFLNINYRDILIDKKDYIGVRSFDPDVSSISIKLYTQVLDYLFKPYLLVDIVIIISLLVLYLHKSDSEELKKAKYIRAAVAYDVFFGAYILFSFITSYFVALSPSYFINALESAISFVFYIDILYLSYYLLPRSSFIVVLYSLLSALFISAPFLVLDPFSARCFSHYCFFMCIIAGELFMIAVSSVNISAAAVRAVSLSAVSLCLSVCCFYSYVNIINKYTDNLRFRYIREQMKSRYLPIEVISLPYPNIAYDCVDLYLQSGSSPKDKTVKSNDDMYLTDILDHYGIDKDKYSERTKVEISLYDYNLGR